MLFARFYRVASMIELDDFKKNNLLGLPMVATLSLPSSETPGPAKKPPSKVAVLPTGCVRVFRKRTPKPEVKP